MATDLGFLAMSKASFDFSNDVVLITGAARGIGYGVAKGFAQAGADVHIVATGGSIHDSAARLSEFSPKRTVTGHICDITDRKQVAQIIDDIKQIDVLINNAGFEHATPINDQSEDVAVLFRRIIDTNILGTYYMTREAVKKMSAGGRIIITSSIWGKTAVADYAGYCSSKHANIGFMRSLAQELGPKGIAVNAVCPGWVRTDAAMRSLASMAKVKGKEEAALLDEIVTGQAMQGLMEPDDMIGPYLFLASDAAANITGQAINVDRGEVMV